LYGENGQKRCKKGNISDAEVGVDGLNTKADSANAEVGEGE
jgi:hypothetical protein